MYLDPVLLDRAFNTQQFITIEDENRNNVIVDLERPIGDTGLADQRALLGLHQRAHRRRPSLFCVKSIYLGLTYRVGAR